MESLLADPHTYKIFSKSLRGRASLPNHFVGDVETYDLAKPFRPVAHQAREQPRRPSRTATEIKHPLSGAQIHQPQRFLGDVEMMCSPSSRLHRPAPSD